MNCLRSATFTLGLGFLFFAACSSSSPPEGSPPTAGTSSSQAGSAPNASGTANNNASGTTNGNTSGSSAGGAGNAGNTGGAPNGTAGSATSAGSSSGGSVATGGSSNQAGSSAAGAPPVVVDLPDVVTSTNGNFWKTGTLTPVTSGNADVTANASSKKQRWDGFGGTFNEAGWDALAQLSEADRALAIKYLFDAKDGANFAYGRLPIGASDYALARYTLSETKDLNMTNFSIAQDKKMLIPFIKAALAVKPDIRLWASPWSPPAWMKDNNNIDAGNMLDNDDILKAFALYLEKFVLAYAGEGLKIEAIHPQNEPGYTNPYPSCAWTQALYIKFIRDYLGPTFEKDKVPAQIWCGTMSNQSDGTIAESLAKDSKAMSYVKGFGLQWNTMGSVGALKSTNQPIMQSEHRCGNYDFSSPHATSSYDPNKPQNDFAYGVESWLNIKDWIDAGVNSYSAWNMVLDTLGTNLNAQKPWHQNALLVVDRGAKKLIATPAYYVFRHLSQFVAPQANVIGTSGGSALAFQNPDGAYVVVLYNSSNTAKPTIVSLGGTKYQFDMPGQGWATIHHK